MICARVSSYAISKSSEILFNATKKFKNILINGNILLSQIIDHVNDTFYDGKSPLHIACLYGHVEVVQALLRAEANVNSRDNDNQTPLHAAVQMGNVKIVKMLINAKADVNSRDRYSLTPLHDAAWKGHVPIVQALLNASATVNTKNTFRARYTPIQLATYKGHHAVVRLLLQHGADTTQVDSLGNSLAHIPALILTNTYATNFRQEQCLYLIHEARNPSSMHWQQEQLSCLLMCLAGVKLATLATLLCLLDTILYQAYDLCACPYYGTDHYTTGLLSGELYAEKYQKTCDLLLAAGVDVTLANKFGRTVLHTLLLPARRAEMKCFIGREGQCQLVRKVVGAGDVDSVFGKGQNMLHIIVKL